MQLAKPDFALNWPSALPQKIIISSSNLGKKRGN
jgi:hypothetical protein